MCLSWISRETGNIRRLVENTRELVKDVQEGPLSDLYEGPSRETKLKHLERRLRNLQARLKLHALAIHQIRYGRAYGGGEVIQRALRAIDPENWFPTKEEIIHAFYQESGYYYHGVDFGTGRP